MDEESPITTKNRSFPEPKLNTIYKLIIICLIAFICSYVFHYFSK
jgi:hypothetical protein